MCLPPLFSLQYIFTRREYFVCVFTVYVIVVYVVHIVHSTAELLIAQYIALPYTVVCVFFIRHLDYY